MNKEEMIDKIADYVVDYPRFEETAHEVAELIFDLFIEEQSKTDASQDLGLYPSTGIPETE